MDSAHHRLNHQHRGGHGYGSPPPSESRHRSLSNDSADPSQNSAGDGCGGYNTASSLTSYLVGAGGFGDSESGSSIYPRAWETTSPDELLVPRPIRRHSNPPERGRPPSSSSMAIPSVSPNQLECPVCPYKATAPNRLKEHIRKHTGERPFVCPVCQKGFGRKTHLDTHMVIHSGEKPFKCTMCDYRATQKGNLKIHMQSHTGEKPHACRYCNYRAAQKMTLRLHLHNKHPEAVELQQGSSGASSGGGGGVHRVLFPTTPPPPQS